MDKTKKHPLVTVVIPTYNRAWILEAAVESVLNQDMDDFELIVVDDGSTDETQRLLSGFADDHRVSIIRQENQGVSASRNRGIAEAKGTYVAFLDSDDLWLPQKLSCQIALFRSKPHIKICQTEEIWIRKGQRVNPKKRHKKPSGMIFEPSVELCLVSPSAVMLHRDLFTAVGTFDESLPACEDYDLWLRISCRYPVYLIDTPLIIKRGGHEDQLSRNPGMDRFRIRSLDKIIQSGLLTCDQSHIALRELRKKILIYAGGCRKRGKTWEAQYYLSILEKYDATA